MQLLEARRRFAKLSNALSSTSPYIEEEIVLAYEYEKVESHRSYEIRGSLEIWTETGDETPLMAFSSNERVQFMASDTIQGVSGVLENDRTYAENDSPSLPSKETFAESAWHGFREELRRVAMENIAGLFAALAKNEERTPEERLAASLYLMDLAGGTRYERYSEELQALAYNAILTGPNGISGFVAPANLPVPTQIEVPTPRTRSLPSDSVERMIQSVVLIETNDGKSGSGLFVTKACLVVTNRHVIEGADLIVLKTDSRKLFLGQVAAEEEGRDLALLTTNAKTCEHLEIAVAEPTIGANVFAIGSPLGLSQSVTKGVVSGLRQDGYSLDSGILK